MLFLEGRFQHAFNIYQEGINKALIIVPFIPGILNLLFSLCQIIIIGIYLMSKSINNNNCICHPIIPNTVILQELKHALNRIEKAKQAT